MRGALRAVAVGAVVLFGALRLAGCGNDDADAPPDPFANFDGDLPERNLDPDGPNDPDAVNVVDPPTYCNGIVFYASLDGTYGPERGGTPGTPFGNPMLVAGGKFGGAVASYQDGGGEAGASVYYYAPPDGGVPWYANEVGTVSLWYRGSALDDDGNPVLWRVMGGLPPSIAGGGLALVALAGSERFGLLDVSASTSIREIVAFPRSLVRPYVSRGEYNHFVSAWQRGDASAGPKAVMLINGGTGKVFDASIDAPDYSDAQPNEAGDLLIPYRAIRNAPWDSDAAAANFRLGGTGTSASEGEIDDVVVWNRVLTLAEMQGIYETNAPIGQACKLK